MIKKYPALFLPLLALSGCMANQTPLDDMTYVQKQNIKTQAMQNCANQGVPKSELAACAANDLKLRDKQIGKDKTKRNNGIALGALGAIGTAAALTHW